MTNVGLELDVARVLMAEMVAEIKAFAKTNRGDVDLVYMNYTDPSQNPLASYGSDNVEFIRKVAKKYDPKGVFQSRIPGGFKISRVG